MSRIAKSPIPLLPGVLVSLKGQVIEVKGSRGVLKQTIHPDVSVNLSENVLTFAPRISNPSALALAGTTRALVNNMVLGVTSGFEKQLTLVGVGYRASVSGQILNLTLGFSHPIDFKIPAGITIETPSQTILVIKGVDKQQVGQVAANIRAFRPPEPYKGKGVRYSDEVIVLKETKKK